MTCTAEEREEKEKSEKKKGKEINNGSAEFMTKHLVFVYVQYLSM